MTGVTAHIALAVTLELLLFGAGIAVEWWLERRQ